MSDQAASCTDPETERQNILSALTLGLIDPQMAMMLLIRNRHELPACVGKRATATRTSRRAKTMLKKGK